MAVKTKLMVRSRIKRGIRKKITGTSERPRLSVYRSNAFIYAQIIDDSKGATLIGTFSGAKGLAGLGGTKIEQSKRVGLKIAELAKEKGIELVVFDRNGFQYHGRVKALADGAREGGLIF